MERLNENAMGKDEGRPSRVGLVRAWLLAGAVGLPGICLAQDSSAGADIVQAMLLGQYSAACVPGGAHAIQDCFTPALTLPDSTAEEALAPRVTVTIKKDRILADGVAVLDLELRDEDGLPVLAVPDDVKRGQLITRLYDRLLEKYEQERALEDVRRTMAVLTQRDDLHNLGELLLSVDRDVPFSVLREVLYTAGQARFGSFHFVTRNPWEGALRTIESSLPAIGPPRSSYEEERSPLLLSLILSDRGISVLGADAVLYPDGRPDTGAGEPSPTVGCKSGGTCTGIDDYDWEELSRLLGLIKDEYPDDLRVILVPEQGIPFDVVVRALDHARWGPHLPLDAEQGAWQYWKSVRRELFPLNTLAGGAK